MVKLRYEANDKIAQKCLNASGMKDLRGSIWYKQ